MIKIMTAEFHLAVSLSVFLHLCHWGNTWRTKILTFITPVLKKNYNKSNCLLWKWFAIFSLELRVYVFASNDHCRICKHFVFTVIVHRKKSDKLTYKSRQSKTIWPPWYRHQTHCTWCSHALFSDLVYFKIFFFQFGFQSAKWDCYKETLEK